MARHGLKVFAVVAVITAAAACERPAAVTSPTSGARPRAAATAGSYSVDGYQLLSASTNGSQTKSLIIGPSGARINFGASMLDVPYQAVAGPTRFTFTLQSSPYISVKLTAVAVTSVKSQWVDGAAVTTFAKPLTLTLSYANAATSIPDPKQLVMLWMENGTVLQAYSPQVDTKGQKLVIDLTHFTDYTPAIPGPDALVPPTAQ